MDYDLDIAEDKLEDKIVSETCLVLSPVNPIVEVDKKCETPYILKCIGISERRIEEGTRGRNSAVVELYPCEYAEAARATSRSLRRRG